MAYISSVMERRDWRTCIIFKHRWALRPFQRNSFLQIRQLKFSGCSACVQRGERTINNQIKPVIIPENLKRFSFKNKNRRDALHI